MEGGAGREVQTSNADDISSVSKIGGVQSLLGLESPIMQGRRRLAVAAMLGAATFGVLEAIQSVARADHSFSEPMSVYASGPYGFVQTVAFLVLAVGSAAVCAAIGLPHPRPPDWQVARGLIVVWSVGVSLAAAFRIDGSGSTAAQVHATASMLSFLSVLAAMFFFTRATRQVPAWYSFGKVSSALASVAALAFVVAGATQPSIVFGVAQRVFLGAVVAWLVAVGARSYVLARDWNIEKLRRALDAYNEGELTPLAELLDPAVSWHGVHGQDIRPCSDRSAVLATMHSRFESGFRLDDVHLTEAGDQVIVKFHSPEGVGYTKNPSFHNAFTFAGPQVVHIQDFSSAVPDTDVQVVP